MPFKEAVSNWSKSKWDKATGHGAPKPVAQSARTPQEQSKPAPKVETKPSAPTSTPTESSPKPGHNLSYSETQVAGIIILSISSGLLVIGLLSADAYDIDPVPMPPITEVCTPGPVNRIFIAEADQIINHPSENQVLVFAQALERYSDLTLDQLLSDIRANKVPKQLTAYRAGDCLTLNFQLNEEYYAEYLDDLRVSLN